MNYTSVDLKTRYNKVVNKIAKLEVEKLELEESLRNLDKIEFKLDNREFDIIFQLDRILNKACLFEWRKLDKLRESLVDFMTNNVNVPIEDVEARNKFISLFLSAYLGTRLTTSLNCDLIFQLGSEVCGVNYKYTPFDIINTYLNKDNSDKEVDNEKEIS